MDTKKEKQIDFKISKIDDYINEIPNLGLKMLQADNGTFFKLDWLAVAVLNRSISLLDGFKVLVTSSNYIAACHLVRLHLDNYLRFNAAWLVTNPHEFAQEVMNGSRIDKLKDSKGKLLKDFYLVEQASIKYPWIQNVYKETSGFVHLSKKHLFMSSKINNEAERTIDIRIGKEDNKAIPVDSKLEAIDCMISITDCIIELILGWTATKNKPHS